MTTLRSRKLNLYILIGLALLISACTTQPAPTSTSVAIQPTLTATLQPSATSTPPTVPPTSTPQPIVLSTTPTTVPPTATRQPVAPSATPTVLPATEIPPTLVVSVPTPHGDGPCVYRAKFLGDITIPDDTQLAPGTAFVKTWRLRNDGTCTWGPSGYALHSLVFYNGDQLGGPAAVTLPAEVQPGNTVDVSVNLIAPTNPGTYRSEWILSVDGPPVLARLLGVGADGTLPVYAQIVVPAPADETGSVQIYNSNAYHYTVSYPADWTVQVNTSAPTGGGSNPEYVTLAPRMGGLPRAQIWALTGVSPMTGFDNCVKNFVFHNLPACKMSLPAGQNPAEDLWVFQNGNAYFYIQLQYQDATSTQVFIDIITSFNFAD